MTEKRIGKWYFGGMASCCAACFTHPLDTLKVHLQTQQEATIGGLQMAQRVVKSQGFLSLYNGLSASLLRQVTYSTTRFGIYEVSKQQLSKNHKGDLPFLQRAGIAAFAGACGGLIGTPGDMINVRMQNDIKLPTAQRRNYKHALDGVYRVFKEEGFTRLFRGASTATLRAVLITTGQLSFYDQVKSSLIRSGRFDDGPAVHFASSLAAGVIATTMTQPVDVIKTRAMSAKPGEFKNLWHIITYTGRLGPMGFFKGYVPAFVRLGPHTILTFLFLEQFKKRLGTPVIERDD